MPSVTGASTGFGRDMTVWALKQGDIVVASAQGFVNIADVTDPNSGGEFYQVIFYTHMYPFFSISLSQ